MRIIAIALLLIGVCAPITGLYAKEMTDLEIISLIIEGSLNDFTNSAQNNDPKNKDLNQCPCPYSVGPKGRCGSESVYVANPNSGLKCYSEDITLDEIERFRAEHNMPKKNDLKAPINSQ
jgi:hypothetical protein